MTRRTNDDDDDEEEEETESHFDFSTMEEIDREIERITKKTKSFFSSQRSAAANDDDRGDETGKNEKGATTTNEEEEARTSNSKEVRSRARREAVEWRRKKIEEKTFDPRAAFRERVKKKKNGNNDDDNTWQSPSVVMRRRKAEEVVVSTSKSWKQLETEWKLFEEKWKDYGYMNRNNNEKQQRVLRFRDIPFPSSGADFLTFLISSQGPFRDDENGRKRAKRELAKRWHPDKFAQNFSRQLKEEDREDIMEMVKEIYQSGTALMNTRSWDG